MTLLFAPLPAAATQSRSANFSNISLEAGSVPSTAGVTRPAASLQPGPLPAPANAPLAARPPQAPIASAPHGTVPAPPPARWPLFAGAGALVAGALAARRRARRQANEVLAVAAHELKSPLTALESYLALMEQDGKSPGAADTRAWLEDVARMRSTAAHLRHTIGDILETTRLDGSRVKLERRTLDLADSARETAAAFQALASEAGIKLTLRAEPAPACGDPARVRRILDNLVANALRHAPNGGEVALSTGRDDSGRVWCAVADNGDGVPPAQRVRLFGRFARLSPPLRGEPGTGLGLHIGRALARAQGGALDYEPLPGACGARFRLTLPPATRA